MAGEAIQQVLLFPFSPIRFNSVEGQPKSEANRTEAEYQSLRDRVNLFLSIREEPYPSFDLVSVNELRIRDFGLTQGGRFNGPDRGHRNKDDGPTGECDYA